MNFGRVQAVSDRQTLPDHHVIVETQPHARLIRRVCIGENAAFLLQCQPLLQMQFDCYALA